MNNLNIVELTVAEHHQLIASNATEQRMTQAAFGLMLDGEEWDAFVAGELQDLRESMLDEQREGR